MPEMPLSLGWGTYADDGGHPLSEDYDKFIQYLIGAEENMVELTKQYIWNALVEELIVKDVPFEDYWEDLASINPHILQAAIDEQIQVTKDNWKLILKTAYKCVVVLDGDHEATDLLFLHSTKLLWWTVNPGEFSISSWVCWTVESLRTQIPCTRSHLDLTINRRSPG